MAKEISYEIIEEIGVLSTERNGWEKKLTVVAWNGGPGKFDIRPWSAGNEDMRKGVTFTTDEILRLRDLLNSYDFETEEGKDNKLIIYLDSGLPSVYANKTFKNRLDFQVVDEDDEHDEERSEEFEKIKSQIENKELVLIYEG